MALPNSLRAGLFILILTNCQSLSEHRNSRSDEHEQKELNYAYELAREGLYKEAIREYNGILRKNNSNHLAQRNIGILYVKIGSYRKALISLRKSLTRFEEDFQANYYLAEAHRALDQYGEAIYRYKRALISKPDDTDIHRALAWSYFKIQYYQEANRSIDKILKRTNNDIEATLIKARIMVKTRQFHTALRILAPLKDRANIQQISFISSIEGDIYSEMKDCANAKQKYKDALKEQPLLAGALLGLGKCLLKEKDNLDLALKYIERSVRIKPKMAEGLLILGGYYEDKDAKKALKYYKYFKKVAKKDPALVPKIPEINHKIKALAR